MTQIDGGNGNSEPEPAETPSDSASEKPVEKAANEESGASADERDSSKKKERVLHTRVPAVLEQELKRFADNLRIPVSNLVRTILEDALNVAGVASENVEERLKSAAKHLEHEREKLKKRVMHDPLEGVFAFQSVTLAMTVECARCKKELKRGDTAHFGIGDAPTTKQTRVFVCDDCLPKE